MPGLYRQQRHSKTTFFSFPALAARLAAQPDRGAFGIPFLFFFTLQPDASRQFLFTFFFPRKGACPVLAGCPWHYFFLFFPPPPPQLPCGTFIM